MKKISTLILGLILFAVASQAQVFEPVKWSVASKKLNDKEAVVFIKATIEKGWHIYSLNLEDGGPIATSFDFPPSKQFSLVGKVAEPKPKHDFEEVFNMDVSYFEKEVVFQQKVKLNGDKATVKGNVEWQACDNERCLPPDEYSFAIAVK